MAITKLNSLAIPPDTVVESDISFPLDSASFTGDLTVDTDTLVVDSTNNRVGVGETNPATTLEVKATNIEPLRLTRSGLGGPNLEFANDDGVIAEIQSLTTKSLVLIADPLNDKANTYMGFEVDGSERMRIDSSGRVGIGTANPNSQTKLEVICPAAFGPAIRVTDNGDASNWSRLDINNSNVTGELIIYQDSGGHAVIRNTVAAGGMTFIAGPAGNPSFFRWENEQGTERMRLDASGDLLVGKTDGSDGIEGLTLSPTRPWCSKAFSANTAQAWGMFDTSTPAYRFYVGWGGTVFATSTSISAISDASLKENVRDLDKGLDTILALKPRRFDWKNGDGNDIMGFIAQEVDEVLPELVHDYMYNEDETKLSLKMGDMIPSLVKAIQEQQAMIETLQAQVAELQGAN